MGLLILLGAIAGEAVLRSRPGWLPPQWQIRMHERTRKHRTVPHADIGFLLHPHQHQQTRNRDYDYLKETDAHGFPNREPWPEQAEIVFLGDSLLTGEGVGIDHQFSTLIDRQLPNLKVINFGVPGAGPERQYRVYRQFDIGHHPHVVVACWYLASDLDNDTHFDAWLKDDGGMTFNRFRLTYARRAAPKPPISRLTRLLRRSVLYGYGQAWLQHIDGERTPWRARRQFDDGTEMIFDERKLPFITTAVTAEDPRLLRAMASLKRLQALAASRQAKVVVMLLPSKEEMYFGDAVETETPTMLTRMRQYLHSARVPTIDLYEILRRRGRTQVPFFPRDSHLNHDGNRIVAEYFVAWWQAQDGLM
ncbi:MAG: hypothetical protein ETSY1_24705 [Candidatus Entotheonella factor]|uniref:AlgX/AlgJ SGNH hydrolase-like domain-containing protein n=2 Tax=Candidatus Entotheonella TaxID=93171 RepID=W4LFP7_ENTF1|nr:MAG: hypothetical protein ETSY1_24705 [Candidatus Entotheonella factor]